MKVLEIENEGSIMFGTAGSCRVLIGPAQVRDRLCRHMQLVVEVHIVLVRNPAYKTK